MEDTTYNGWTNYATWRVQLELVDDEVNNMLENDPQYFKGRDKFEIADELKEFVENIIADYSATDSHSGLASIVEGYAYSFLDDVNWNELAEHAIDRAKEYAQEEA